METYEADFYRPENLEGYIRNAQGNPSVLCFKDPETHTLGRIVLERNNPYDLNENIGRAVVFAENTHSRREIEGQPGSNLQFLAETVGTNILLHLDEGNFVPVTDENKEELTALIDRQQGLMEGHKRLLKLALDLFEQGPNALPTNLSDFHKSIVIKAHQHIINSNSNSMPDINRDRAILRAHCQNPPPIGWRMVPVPLASAYPSDEFHCPYGKSDLEPFRGGVVQAEFAGTPEQWGQLQEDQQQAAQLVQPIEQNTPAHPLLSAFYVAQRPEESSIGHSVHEGDQAIPSGHDQNLIVVQPLGEGPNPLNASVDPSSNPSQSNNTSRSCNRPRLC